MTAVLCSECGGNLPVCDERVSGSVTVVELKDGRRLHHSAGSHPFLELDDGRLYAAAFGYHEGGLYAFCSMRCKQHWLDDSQEGAALKDSDRPGRSEDTR